MKTHEIKVKKGDPIAPAWERLVRWVDSIKVIPCAGVRITETKNGTIITVSNKTSKYRPPFEVGISSSASIFYASIRPGIVNGEFPYIKDDAGKSGWRRSDNRDEDGMKFDPPKETPRMKIDLSNADKGKLYISLRVKPNKAGTIVQPRENLRIVQTKDAKGPRDGAGYYPLAMVYLSKDGKSADQVFQIVHHNMRYIYQAKESTKGETTGNRHLFFPA